MPKSISDTIVRVKVLPTYSEMTRLVAVVAAATRGTAVQAQGRTVSLDMAQSLAVVALLGYMYSQYPVQRQIVTSFYVLSVVRGRGQALDSCPARVHIIIRSPAGDISKTSPYQVACLEKEN